MSTWQFFDVFIKAEIYENEVLEAKYKVGCREDLKDDMAGFRVSTVDDIYPKSLKSCNLSKI